MKSKFILLAVALCAAAASCLHAASLTVAWDPVPTATGYIVERALGSGSTLTFTEISRPTGTNYVDSGLADATTYSYRVKCFNATAISAYSNTASATTAATLPAPGNVKAGPTPVVAILTLKPNQRVLVANSQVNVRANPNDAVRKLAPNESVQVLAAAN